MAPPIQKERSGFALRMREATETFGTQESCARECACSPRQFRKYLADEAAPSFEMLSRFASVTGFNLQWLATGEGQKRTSSAELTANLFPRVKLLIENAGGLTAAAERINVHPDKLFAAISHESLQQPILQLAATMQVSIDWLAGHLVEDEESEES